MAQSLKVGLEIPERPIASWLEFRSPFLVVGREPRADLPIASREVSRRHAYFQVVAGRVFCVDLGSRTGVRWGDGIRPLGWVDPGQGVDVGPARIRFDVGEGDSRGQGGDLPISRSFERPALPDATLELLGTKSDRNLLQVGRAMVLIGRSPICRVRLDGPEIARIHASIVRTPAGTWVVDLLGREEGLRVRGEPARSARLEDGDEIELGNHRLRIRIGRADRPPARSELATRPRGQGGRPARVGVGSPSGLDREGESRGLGDLKGSLDPVVERLFDQFDRMHQQTTEQFRQAILMMFRMHQDQMELIRRELSRLDRLEEEQRALQEEMTRGHPPRPGRVVLRLVSGESTSSPLPPRAPRPAPVDPEAGQAAPPPAVRGPSRVPPTSSDPDPHARLSRRLAEIQDERQGLWKRLLGSLTGDESARILP